MFETKSRPRQSAVARRRDGRRWACALVAVVLGLPVAQAPPASAIVAERAELRTPTSGSVIGWGHARAGINRSPVDAGPATAVAAGDGHSLALRRDGTVVAWGLDDGGQATVPEDVRDVVQIAAAGEHSLAVTARGRWSAGAAAVAGTRRCRGPRTCPRACAM